MAHPFIKHKVLSLEMATIWELLQVSFNATCMHAKLLLLLQEHNTRGQYSDPSLLYAMPFAVCGGEGFGERSTESANILTS